MEDRFELQARALQDTAHAWEALADLLTTSLAQSVAPAAGAGPDGAAEWGQAATAFWSAVEEEVSATAALARGWAQDLRAVVDDVAGVERLVVADLQSLLRGWR